MASLGVRNSSGVSGAASGNRAGVASGSLTSSVVRLAKKSVVGLLLVLLVVAGFSGCKRQLGLVIPDEFCDDGSRLEYYQRYQKDLRGVIFDPVVSPENILKTLTDRGIRNLEGNVFIGAEGDLFIGPFKFDRDSVKETAFFGADRLDPAKLRIFYDRGTRLLYVHDESLTRIFDARTGKVVTNDLTWELKGYSLDEKLRVENIEQKNIEFGFANGNNVYFWNKGKLIHADRKTRRLVLLWDAGNCSPRFVDCSADGKIAVFDYNPDASNDVGCILLDVRGNQPMLSVVRVPQHLEDPDFEIGASEGESICFCEDISPDGKYVLFAVKANPTDEDFKKTYRLCEYSDGMLTPKYDYSPRVGSRKGGVAVTETLFPDNGLTFWSLYVDGGKTEVKKCALPDGKELANFTVNEELLLWTGIEDGRAMISADSLFISVGKGRGSYVDFNVYNFNTKTPRYTGIRIAATQRLAYDSAGKRLGMCDAQHGQIFDMTTGRADYSSSVIPGEVFTNLEFEAERELFILASIQGTEYVKRELKRKEGGGFSLLGKIFAKDPEKSEPKKPFIGKKYRYFATEGQFDYYQSETEVVEKDNKTGIKTVIIKPDGEFDFTHLLNHEIFVARRADGIYCLVARNSHIFYEFPMGSEVWANHSGQLFIRLPQQSANDVVYKLDPKTLKVVSREEARFERYVLDLEGNYFVYRDLMRGQYFISKWQSGSSNSIVKHVLNLIRKYN